MTDIPIVVTAAGLQPTPPATIQQNLIALVAATNPGYTATLPGSLIEDISSTDVGAIVLCDSALVELINALTPYASNAFTLNQLGEIYGVTLGQPTNTSVYVTFYGPPGFVIAKGFTVSDGTYQYVVQDGGIISSGGSTPPLFCLALLSGSWVIPSGTVTSLITSVPSALSPPLSCTNLEPGTPGGAAETQESYRSRVLQAGLAASQGMATYLKTLLNNVSGVQPNLVSVLQIGGGGWEIIVGGSGDPYQIAYAIYQALFDVSTLVGSTLLVSNITAATTGVVTTTLNHGYVTGESVTLAGVNPSTYNGTYPVIVISENTFSIGNTSGFGAYVSGGVCTPNARNQLISINDYPNTYVIPFVVPPEQTVTMVVTWNTSATNPVSSAAMAQLGAPALMAYVNSLSPGQPMNLFELISVFQLATASVLPTQLLTRLVFTVSINGVGVSPEAGTGIIPGDPESYFYSTLASFNIVQG